MKKPTYYTQLRKTLEQEIKHERNERRIILLCYELAAVSGIVTALYSFADWVGR